MSPEQIHDALNLLDDDMIEAVDKLRQKKKQNRKKMRQWLAMAACLACFCMTGLAFHIWSVYTMEHTAIYGDSEKNWSFLTLFHPMKDGTTKQPEQTTDQSANVTKDEDSDKMPTSATGSTGTVDNPILVWEDQDRLRKPINAKKIAKVMNSYITTIDPTMFNKIYYCDMNNEKKIQYCVGMYSEDMKSVAYIESTAESTPYAFCLIQVKDNVDVLQLKEEILQNANPAKWETACAQKVVVADWERFILLFMGTKEQAEDICQAFETAMGKIGVILEK